MLDRRFPHPTLMAVLLCLVAGCDGFGSDGNPHGPTGPFTKPLNEEYEVRNSEPIPVEGFAIVTGLRGTGGVGIPQGMGQNVEGEIHKRLADLEMARNALDERDTAVVRITGLVPPFSPRGSLLDVTVNALNDGTSSLEGGVLPIGWMKTYVASTTESGGTVRHYSIDQIKVSGPITLQPPGIPDADFEPDARVGYIPAGGLLKEYGFDPLLEAIGRPTLKNLPKDIAEKERPDKIQLPRERSRTMRMTDAEAYEYVSDLDGSRFKKLALVTERAINRRFGRGIARIGDMREGYAVTIGLPRGGYIYNWSRFINVLGQVKPSDLLDGGASDVERNIDLLKNGSPDDQGRAALRLEAIGKAAVPALNELARAGNDDVSLAAATILAALRNQAARPYMMRYVPGGTPIQRLNVATSLPFLGSSATDALKRMLTDDIGVVRYYALFGLDTLRVSLPNHKFRHITDGEKNVLFYLDHLDQPGRTMVVIKTIIPRRIALFGPDPNLKPNVKVVQGPFVLKTNAIGNASLTLDIGHYDNETRPLGQVSLMSLISKLHAYGVSINDINAIVKKLVEGGHVPVRPDDLYWVEQRT
jgi:hypothetical protein